MRYLCIFIQEPLLIAKLERPLTDCIELNGSIYQKRPTADDEIVFYDWLIDHTGIIRGLEIHLSPNDPVLRTTKPLNTISMIETDHFVRIWFSEKKEGEPQGLEAFGDIFFFRTVDKHLCIIVSIDSWLSPPQSHQLSSLGSELD